MASELGVQTIQHTNGTDAITIDSSGNLTVPQDLTVTDNLTLTNQPRLYVQGNNGAYISTSPIPFGNKVIDTADGWNSTTNTYTVPVAGDYMVMVDLGIVLTSGTNGIAYAQIQHNTSNVAYTYIQTASGAQYHGLCINKMYSCSANDTFKINFHNTNGTYYNGSNECRLSIYKVG